MGKTDNARVKEKKAVYNEKKAARKAQEERINRRVENVKHANSVDDPLALLPKPFSVYNKNGLEVTLETTRVAELPEETQVRISPS